MAEEVRREFVIPNKKGLHARAAAKFVACVDKYDAQIKVCKDGNCVGGDSIVGLLMLSASQGTTILLIANGIEAIKCADEIQQLIEANFFEKDASK